MGLIEDFGTLVQLIDSVNESLGETQDRLEASADGVRGVQDALAFDDTRGGFDRSGFRAGGAGVDDGFRAFDPGGLTAGETRTTADGLGPGVATGADIRQLSRDIGALVGALSGSTSSGGGGSGGDPRLDAFREGFTSALDYLTQRYGFSGSQTTGFGLTFTSGAMRGNR